MASRNKDNTGTNALAPHSKLTREDVIAIRKDILTTPTLILAERYGLSPQGIRNVAQGKTHSKMNDEAPPVKRVPRDKKLRGYRVGKEREKRIFALLNEGYSQAEISRTLKLTQGWVSRVVRGLK